MRVAEHEGQEQRFFEGEPELEPPEELAVAELDDDAVLEGELDNEDVLEQDVDDELLTTTLENLVHLGDDDGDPPASLRHQDPVGEDEGEDDEALDAMEVDDLEDLEESLDRLLEERLALEDTAAAPDDDEDDMVPVSAPTVGVTMRVVGAGGPGVVEELPAGCGRDEFVCRGCFLVRHRAQLADPAGMRCHDCAG
jgi:hypothetical protein